jgi:hypothetical protein
MFYFSAIMPLPLPKIKHGNMQFYAVLGLITAEFCLLKKMRSRFAHSAARAEGAPTKIGAARHPGVLRRAGTGFVPAINSPGEIFDH